MVSLSLLIVLIVHIYEQNIQLNIDVGIYIRHLLITSIRCDKILFTADHRVYFQGITSDLTTELNIDGAYLKLMLW